MLGKLGTNRDIFWESSKAMVHVRLEYVTVPKGLKKRAYSICAPNSLVVLSFPHASNFCSLFPTPLAETLTNVHNRRLPSWPLTDLWGHVGLC